MAYPTTGNQPIADSLAHANTKLPNPAGPQPLNLLQPISPALPFVTHGNGVTTLPQTTAGGGATLYSVDEAAPAAGTSTILSMPPVKK